MKIYKCSWCGNFFEELGNCPLCKDRKISEINLIFFRDLNKLLGVNDIQNDFGTSDDMELIDDYATQKEVINFLNEWYEIV